MNSQNKLAAASENKVLKALMQKSPQTWSELKEATKISSRTLRKALLRLEKQGKIFRQIAVGKKYPPPVLYGLTDVGKKSLAPLIFSAKTLYYIWGWECKWEKAELTINQLKIPLKNVYQNLSVEERLQVMARRFFVTKLFGLLKALETGDSNWFELVSEGLPVIPHLLMQLNIPPKTLNRTKEGEVIARADAEILEQEPLIFKEDWRCYLDNEAATRLKNVLSHAFPKEYEELQKLYNECIETT